MAAVKIKNVRLSRFAIHLWLLYEDDEFRRGIKLTVTDESLPLVLSLLEQKKPVAFPVFL